MGEVHAVDGGQLDQIGDQSDGVEGLVRFAQNPDVEVPRVRPRAGRARNFGLDRKDPDRLPLAERVEPTGRRGGPQPGQSLRRRGPVV